MPDSAAGEIPCAFVVLRNGVDDSSRLSSELTDFVGQRLTHYKQPREVRFVGSIPRNPSGKILRRELRAML
jgi:acyl-coenzyme A synthetase/AMP-(fatty) acid ligase